LNKEDKLGEEIMPRLNIFDAVRDRTFEEFKEHFRKEDVSN